MTDGNARLMTVDELFSLEKESIVYLETRKNLRPAFTLILQDYTSWIDRKPVKMHEYILMTPVGVYKRWRFELYNRTWRLWTDKPTDEQRKVAAWDGKRTWK